MPSYDPPCTLQTAVRCTFDEFYFTVPIMFCTLFNYQASKISFEEYQNIWMQTQSPKDLFLTMTNVHPKYQSADAVRKYVYL